MATELTTEAIGRMRATMAIDTEPFLIYRDSLAPLLDAAERCAAVDAYLDSTGIGLRGVEGVKALDELLLFNSWPAIHRVLVAARRMLDFARNERSNGVGELEAMGELSQSLRALDGGA